MKSLVDITADANKTLQEVSSLLKNTSDNVDTVQNNFAQLGTYESSKTKEPNISLSRAFLRAIL